MRTLLGSYGLAGPRRPPSVDQGDGPSLDVPCASYLLAALSFLRLEDNCLKYFKDVLFKREDVRIANGKRVHARVHITNYNTAPSLAVRTPRIDAGFWRSRSPPFLIFVPP